MASPDAQAKPVALVKLTSAEVLRADAVSRRAAAVAAAHPDDLDAQLLRQRAASAAAQAAVVAARREEARVAEEALARARAEVRPPGLTVPRLAPDTSPALATRRLGSVTPRLPRC